MLKTLMRIKLLERMMGLVIKSIVMMVSKSKIKLELKI